MLLHLQLDSGGEEVSQGLEEKATKLAVVGLGSAKTVIDNNFDQAPMPPFRM
jgi:hypothetical protein